MVPPKLQAIVLADKIYRDLHSGKFIICGTFTGIKFGTITPRTNEEGQKVVPGGMVAGTPSLYICLTGVHHKLDLDLRYINLKDHKVLFKTVFSVDADSPLRTIEGAFPLPPLEAFGYGQFAIEVLCEDELLGSWRVKIEDHNASEHEEETTGDQT